MIDVHVCVVLTSLHQVRLNFAQMCYLRRQHCCQEQTCNSCNEVSSVMVMVSVQQHALPKNHLGMLLDPFTWLPPQM